MLIYRLAVYEHMPPGTTVIPLMGMKKMMISSIMTVMAGGCIVYQPCTYKVGRQMFKF